MKFNFNSPCLPNTITFASIYSNTLSNWMLNATHSLSLSLSLFPLHFIRNKIFPAHGFFRSSTRVHLPICIEGERERERVPPRNPMSPWLHAFHLCYSNERRSGDPQVDKSLPLFVRIIVQLFPCMPFIRQIR